MGYFPFLGGSFNGRSPSFDAARSINFYLEPSESGASRSPAMLIGTPGLALWVNLAGGAIRGEIPFNTTTSVVIAGGNCWRVMADKTATLLGPVSINNQIVSLASNGQVIMMVDGPNGYFIDPIAGTITPATDGWAGGTRVDFIDGYFVWNVPNTGKFQISGLYATTIDPLDFATAEGSPDALVTLIVDHREIWLFGTNTVEVWYDSGDVDFPFARISGAFLEIGCAAPYSVAKADNSLFWLAEDDRGFGTVQRANGYSPVRVSNHAVEFAIGKYQADGGIADAVAYSYSQEGHLFYVLTFPSANGGIGATWVLDVSTNLWHERAWRNPDTAELGRHRSNCQMAFAGLIIVGDWQTGNLYVMDLDTYTDNGDLIPSIRICPHITDDGKYSFFDTLELFMQTGIGLPSGQGSDPQAMLQWSDDGGYVWSNEVWRSIGKIGERKARVRWTRLGRSRDRLFRVEITDPVKRIITSASLITRPGLS